MEKNMQLFSLIKGKIGTILLSGILLGSLSFLSLVLTQKNFKVTSDFLIVQNQAGAQDFYTTAKSTEYIGKILGDAVYSDLFIDEVINSGSIANKEFLPFDKKDRMDEWEERVKVDDNFSVGRITVANFDNDRAQALETSKAIADTLNKKNNLFRGNDQNIEVRIISGPTIEKNPSGLNILFSIVIGFLAGVFVAIAWLNYFGDSLKYGNYSVGKDEYEESLKYLGEK